MNITQTPRSSETPASVELLCPLVDLGLDVVHPGGGVGLHLRPLAACAGGGLPGLLLGVLDGQVHVDLGLVDSLPELVTGLAGGSLRRRFRVRDVLLERVQLCGEVHDPSLPCVDCRSCCSQRRALAAGASTLPASGRWSWPGGPSKM